MPSLAADKIVKLEVGPGRWRGQRRDLSSSLSRRFAPVVRESLSITKTKTYFHCTFDPTGSKTYPMEPLKKIREDAPCSDPRSRRPDRSAARRPRICGVADDRRPAATPRRHVWVDPQTDLPLEIGYDVDDGKQPCTTTTLRFSNFRWNEDLDPKIFDPRRQRAFAKCRRRPSSIRPFCALFEKRDNTTTQRAQRTGVFLRAIQVLLQPLSFSLYPSAFILRPPVLNPANLLPPAGPACTARSRS